MEEKMKSYSEKMEDNIQEVTYYMDVARSVISEKYGVAYMEEHPDLVICFMRCVVIKDLESALLDLSEKLGNR